MHCHRYLCFWSLVEMVLRKDSNKKQQLLNHDWKMMSFSLHLHLHNRYKCTSRAMTMAIPNSCTLTILRHLIIVYLVQVCQARNKNDEMSKRLLDQLEVMKFKRRRNPKETITTQKKQRAGANTRSFQKTTACLTLSSIWTWKPCTAEKVSLWRQRKPMCKFTPNTMWRTPPLAARVMQLAFRRLLYFVHVLRLNCVS